MTSDYYHENHREAIHSLNPQPSILNPLPSKTSHDSRRLVTILIPHYKTLEVTQLCLQLIQKFTDLNQVRVMVIDNGSHDASTEYLRSLSWIDLIERQPAPEETPPIAHAKALDLAFERVTTPYVLSIHTDTMVKNEKWLDYLRLAFEKSSDIASVGSWKLEAKPWFRRWAKAAERALQLIWYSIVHKENHAIQGVGKNYYYLRSHCALYRTAILRKHHLTFSDSHENAGKVMHKKLQELGYRTVFLPSETLGQYVDHLNHATTVLNPELGSRKKSITKGSKRIKKALKKLRTEVKELEK